jgi:hypothetical protein
MKLSGLETPQEPAPRVAPPPDDHHAETCSNRVSLGARFERMTHSTTLLCCQKPRDPDREEGIRARKHRIRPNQDSLIESNLRGVTGALH